MQHHTDSQASVDGSQSPFVPVTDVGPSYTSIIHNGTGRLPYHLPLTYELSSPHMNNPSGRSEDDALCNDSGNTCLSAQFELQTIKCIEGQLHAQDRAVPHNISCRIANRSTGLPLETIIEQRSYSTLHSELSLGSTNHQHLVFRTADRTASTAHAPQPGRCMNKTALHNIQDHIDQQKYEEKEIDDPAGSVVDPALLCADLYSAAPIALRIEHGQPSGGPQHQNHCDDSEGKGLKGLLRGVIQHVRGASGRSESQPSLLNWSSPVESQTERADTTREACPHIRDQEGESEFTEGGKRAYDVSARTDSISRFLTHTPDTCGKNSKISSSDPETLARGPSTVWHIPSKSLSALVHLPELSLPGPHLPDLCDARFMCKASKMREAQDGYTSSGAHTLSRSMRDDNSTRHTFNGISIDHSDTPSLYDYDQFQETSLCSTDSTDYSGTVLGIDLDLKLDFAPASPHINPIWVRTQTSSPSQQVPSGEVATPPGHPPYSITSSALPILLPLAAASGIVQPNYTTPHVSFYSPSGNLIQTEDSSSPVFSTSDHQTSTYLREPLARPAIIPLTTPPQSSIPLPLHLKKSRKKQNKSYHEESHIVPQSISPIILGNVKGCGGIIRMNSLTPHSGIPSCSKHHSKPNHTFPSFSRHFKSKSTFSNVYTSRTGSSIWTSCTSFKGNNRITRQKPDGRSAFSSTAASEFGPIVGRVIRACFCQDGYTRLASRDGCLGETYNNDARPGHDSIEVEVENVRIVEARRRDSLVDP